MFQSEERGRIKWATIDSFFNAARLQRKSLIWGLIALCLASACWSAVSLLSGRLADRILAVARAQGTAHLDFEIRVLFALTTLALLIMYLGNRYGRLLVNQTLIRALTLVHECALASVLNSPLKFFHQTESGRIVSRFSADYLNASQSLDRTMATFLYSILAMFFCIISISLTQPRVLIVAVPFGFGLFFVSRYFGRQARDLQRSASRVSAQCLAHVNETGNLSVSIRALNLSEQMQSRMGSLISEAAHLSMKSSEMSNHRALVQSLFALALISLSFFMLSINYAKGYLTLGEAGAVITLLMVILRNFILVIELLNTMEVGFVSIERLIEFTRLPSEEKLFLIETHPVDDAHDTTKHFVQQQDAKLALQDLFSLQFDHVSVRYSEDGMWVLHNLCGRMVGKKIVGIVGRTGAGKSTLVASLLRFVPLSAGRIFLQGVDLSGISIKEARQKIAFVSQDPILFSGTLLRNIAPNADENDLSARERALQVLDLVGLGEWLRQLSQGLETSLIERGANLSQGQRQLICLARAMSQSPEILVLDEATSAVDTETENMVGSALLRIKTQIPILLIAHRPVTIQLCDEVWRLADGRIVEVVHPTQVSLEEELS